MGNACGVVLVNGEPPSDAEEELEETGTDESQPLATAAHSSRPSEPELPAPEGRAGDENKMAQKKWHKGQLLGEGSFGRVWMALDESSGELQAVKEVPLPAQSSEQAENAASQLQEEIALLQRIQHQNIVDYAGYQRLERSLCIFLRYVSGGSVASLLHSFGAFPERVVKNYSAQLARGLEFLHSNGVVHRDIKGSNALVTTSGVVKLADFGASKPLDQLISATSGFKSFRGTPHWMAPEAVRQEGAGRPSDVWSMGCVVIEMATARPPWPEAETQMGVLWQIASTSRGPELPQSLSETGRDMLSRCFRRQPKERIAASQMLAHEFLRHEQVPLDEDALQHATAGLERPSSSFQQPDGAEHEREPNSNAPYGSAAVDLPEVALEVDETENAKSDEKRKVWLNELQEEWKRLREKHQNHPQATEQQMAMHEDHTVQRARKVNALEDGDRTPPHEGPS